MKKFDEIARLLVPERPRAAVELHTGLAGRLSWRLERAGRIIDAGEQRNLITDAGLDAWALCGYKYGSYITTDPFRAEGALGTGSTAPATGDTSLVAEIADTADGGNDSVASQGIASGEEVLAAEKTYVWDFTGAHNLTEWGLRPSGGSLSVRSLFYEADGTTPKTISVQTNDRLTLVHTLEVTAAPVGTNVAATWTVTEYDRAGTDLGDTVLSGWMTIGSDGDKAKDRLMMVMPERHKYRRHVRGHSAALTGLNPAEDYPSQTTYSAEATVTLSAYSAGSYTRDQVWAIGAADANGVWQGWSLVVSGYYSNHGAGGLMFAFDGQTWEKLNTHTAQLTITTTWGRT